MRRLVVFARSPVPGSVKTRLSPALPASLAAQLYRAMLADAIDAAAGTEADERILYWSRVGSEEPSVPVPGGFVVRHQVGIDLGERLAAAFAALLAGPTDRVVVIGADCPDLDSARIERAFTALEAHDLVLGPASDGGYYLIGLRPPAPPLFDGVAWGTGRVLEQTLARARRAGLAVSMLGELADFDTPADLVGFVARRCRATGAAGQHTADALREMGLLPPV